MDCQICKVEPAKSTACLMTGILYQILTRLIKVMINITVVKIGKLRLFSGPKSQFLTLENDYIRILFFHFSLMPSPSAFSKFVLSVLKVLGILKFLSYTQNILGVLK